jgi:branched-chain amino acid transport system ATP-binding protein
MDRVFDLFPVLSQRRGQLAGTLSGGEQQMLAIGRALTARPRLLLDEPALGQAPLLVKAIFATIREVNRSGVTLLLVEQNARVALGLAHRG